VKTRFVVAVLALVLAMPAQVKGEPGVSLGLQVYALYQDASSSLDGRDDNAFGNINRFFGDWTVFKGDTGNLGRVEWRVESRSNIGNFQAPGSLASATGIARCHDPQLDADFRQRTGQVCSRPVGIRPLFR